MSDQEIIEKEELEIGVREDNNRDEEVRAKRQFGPFTLDLPSDWEAPRLGEVKSLITRGRQPSYAEKGVPVINQECIYWDGWHFDNLKHLDSDAAAEWPEKYFPKKGDVILNSTGQGTLGRAQVYPDHKRRAVDSHVTLLRTSERLNPHFHRYFLESHFGQALLYSMCVNGSTGQIELSKTRLDLMPAPLPPLSEQRKIASVLLTVDRAIQKNEEIIEQVKKTKKGVLQRIYQVGIGGYKNGVSSEDYTPEHWGTKKLEELCNIGGGGTPKKSNEMYWEGDILWATPKDFINFAIKDTQDKLTNHFAPA